MSEQEHELHIDNDFIQEQTTTALINPTSFLEHISVQTNLFEQLKSEF